MTVSIDTAYEDPDLWPRLAPLIREEQAKSAHKMVNGMCKTMDSYTESVGRHRALQWVLDMAKQLNEPPAPPKDPAPDE